MAANTTISVGTSSGGIQAKDGDDSLQLQSSNHPGMVLVTSPLNGRNFSAWSRAVKIALGAKLKLGFITGKCKKPAVDSEHYKQWVRIDCMVTSWLLNSITKNITDVFLYAKSARELWVELEERFARCNGPLLYQLQSEITSITQGDLSVVEYFTKLKILWDELVQLTPLPDFTCGTAKAITELTNQNHLMQFLMGLNDMYDHVKSNSCEGTFAKLQELNEQKKKNANGGKAFLAQTNGDKKAHKDAKMDEVASVSEDQMSIEVVGVARQIGKLYVLENNSFSSLFIDQFSSEPFSLVSQVAHVDLMLWHKDWETRPIKNWMLGLLVYVDDILLTDFSEDSIVDVKRYLDDLFTIKDLEYAKYFLGLEIARSQDGTSIMQRKYIEALMALMLKQLLCLRT
ncbi:hypothetical protein Sango_2739700 [Sesamum angolense]|uniref:Retrotransposon Copia-like N-terminal domain-containing protein n=1 Tax=Sesamum angolense TaxID=2727404 RepID=A0AAE1T9D5_9LAMI|nr:hypothetical protein Sango_2739700 [Sesamum angolense]